MLSGEVPQNRRQRFRILPSMSTFPVSNITRGTVYYASGPNGLRIIDVSNPSSCVEVPGFTETDLDETVCGLDIQGNICCLISDKKLTVLDISNVPNVVQLGSISGVSGTRVKIYGEYAYICSSVWTSANFNMSADDFIICDISDVSSPVEVSRLPDSPMYDFALSGNCLYYAESKDNFNLTGGALKILDVSDKAAPAEIITVYLAKGEVH